MATDQLKSFYEDNVGSFMDLTDAAIQALPQTIRDDLATVMTKIANDDLEVSFAQTFEFPAKTTLFVIGYHGDTSEGRNGAFIYTSAGELILSGGDHGTPDDFAWDDSPKHPTPDPVLSGG
jgi:hypothetical protein